MDHRNPPNRSYFWTRKKTKPSNLGGQILTMPISQPLIQPDLTSGQRVDPELHDFTDLQWLPPWHQDFLAFLHLVEVPLVPLHSFFILATRCIDGPCWRHAGQETARSATFAEALYGTHLNRCWSLLASFHALSLEYLGGWSSIINPLVIYIATSR